jgi:hypothetical protein
VSDAASGGADAGVGVAAAVAAEEGGVVIVLVREITASGGVREWWARADVDVYWRRRRDAVRRSRRGAVTGMALVARRGRGR